MEDKDVNTPEVVAQEGVEEVESPTTEEETQEPEESSEATIEPVTPEEPEQQVPYDRFKEVNDAKKLAEDQNRQLMEMLQRNKQPEQPQQDPYAHLSADEQVFYRNQEKMMRRVAEETLEKTQRQTQAQIKAASQEFARIRTNQFLKDHSDVKLNSPELAQIISKVNMGYNEEDAYKAVMWDKREQSVQHKAQTKVKQQMQVKKKANTEHEGVNQVLPGKRSFKEDLAAENWDD